MSALMRTSLSRLPRPTAATSKRWLNLHEYQSAAIMASHGVNVPPGIAATSVADAVAAAKELGGDEVVIKSQILAGGRGLGTFTNGFQGGVHRAPEGGTSIEDLVVAEKIIKVPIDVVAGLTDANAEAIVAGLGVSGDKEAAKKQIGVFIEVFKSCDCTMVEVNPLAEDDQGTLIAADAKIGFDDNAAFRQKDILARAESQEDQRRRRPRRGRPRDPPWSCASRARASSSARRSSTSGLNIVADDLDDAAKKAVAVI
ncbi:ADP-forming succinate-CoA ligase [Aureococcus anophagefferens]|uniref:ADP-forming succinate-CoA ligase n=1 Tax=Aureococcus anophagefferens TaxID=44056 RepID=A0ABR1G6A9_AURAN